jgi:hypothetical protein
MKTGPPSLSFLNDTLERASEAALLDEIQLRVP